MSIFPCRYLARLIIETTTPLRVGNGDVGPLVDSLVVRDANGLPCIPGTSLAGVLRHVFEDDTKSKSITNQLFGFQGNDDDATMGEGSRIIVNGAGLLSPDGKTVHERFEPVDMSSEYYREILQTTTRDHVRINHRGVAVNAGKFEEELVLKGARFVFDLEMIGTKDDKDQWEAILALFSRTDFRIGAGTRNGFGDFKVAKCLQRSYDLKTPGDRDDYLDRVNSYNVPINGVEEFTPAKDHSVKYRHYRLKLAPEFYYSFGSGVGNEDTNATVKTESYISWSRDHAVVRKENILIPATSIKGAIAHRLAFHYNKTKGDVIGKTPEGTEELPEFDLEAELAKVDLSSFISHIEPPLASTDGSWDQLTETVEKLDFKDLRAWKEIERKYRLTRHEVEKKYKEPFVGSENKAVKTLFGFAADHQVKAEDKPAGARGRVLFSDVYLPTEVAEVKRAIIPHVRIDRFTGGSYAGALFSEEVVTSAAFVLDIYVENAALEDSEIEKSLEAVFDDVKNGRLALGGKVNRGHGTFQGDWEIIDSNSPENTTHVN